MTTNKYAIITAPGSYYAQLQWMFEASMNVTMPVTPPAATYTFLQNGNTGKYELYSLDETQQMIGQEQAAAFVNSMRNPAVAWGRESSIQYLASAMQTQMASGKGYVDAQQQNTKPQTVPNSTVASTNTATA